jgi:CHAT domain-containing protein
MAAHVNAQEAIRQRRRPGCGRQNIVNVYGLQKRPLVNTSCVKSETRATRKGSLHQRQPVPQPFMMRTPDPDGEARLMQAWEGFQEVRLECDLVVLSGCETGLGRLYGGEGLLGLTRAFFFAGARSLLVSLWPIDDRSASELMEAFYAGLLEGLPKDEALRRAQARLIESARCAHPYFWAVFQLQGDPGPVPALRGRPGASFLALSLVGLGILLGLGSVRAARGRSRRSQAFR